MKHLRKPLALLLALMIAFGIGASSAAKEVELEAEAVTETPMVVSEAVTEPPEESAETVEAAMEPSAEIAEAPVSASAFNWEDFYFITDLPQDLYVKRNKSFTLSVEVNIPDGVEVTYQWYVGVDRTYVPIEGATASTLQLGPDDDSYPKAENPHSQIVEAGSRQSYFYCEITAIDSVDRQSETRYTRQATITVRGSFWERLSSVTVGPFKKLFDGWFIPKNSHITGFDRWLLNFFILLVFPFFLVNEYAENFIALFK